MAPMTSAEVKAIILSNISDHQCAFFRTLALHSTASTISEAFERIAGDELLASASPSFRMWVESGTLDKKAARTALSLLPRVALNGEEERRLQLLLLRESTKPFKSLSETFSSVSAVEKCKERSGLFKGHRSATVAEHLAALDWHLFSSVSEADLLSLGTSSRSPSLVAMADRFNQVSFWVATKVLVPEEAADRAKTMTRLIQVAERLRCLNAHQTAAQILAGLNMACVQRLKATWALLSERSQAEFESLDALYSPMGNYAKYRELLRAQMGRNPASLPLPIFGIFLRDVTYILDGNPSRNPDGSINFERLLLLSQQLDSMRSLQAAAPAFSLKQHLVSYLENIQGIDDEEVLYKLSLERQPLAGASDKDEGAAPLSKIMQEPMLATAFRKFLVANDGAACLALYQDLQNLTSNEESKGRLNDIYGTYVADQAPLFVPLPDNTQAVVSKCLESKSYADGVAVLSATLPAVQELVQSHLPAFHEDPAYKETMRVISWETRAKRQTMEHATPLSTPLPRRKKKSIALSVSSSPTRRRKKSPKAESKRTTSALEKAANEAANFVATTPAFSGVILDLLLESDSLPISDQLILIACETYHSASRLDLLRHVALEVLLSQDGDASNLLRQTTVPSQVLSQSLVADGTTSALKQALSPVIRRVTKTKSRLNFIEERDGEEKVKQRTLLEAASAVLAAVESDLTEKEAGEGSSWLPSLKKCLAIFQAACEVHGGGITELVASVFFSRLLCPLLVAAEDLPQKRRKLVLVSKTIMAAVSRVVGGDIAHSADARKLQEQVRNIQRMLLDGQRKTGRRSVPAPPIDVGRFSLLVQALLESNVPVDNMLAPSDCVAWDEHVIKMQKAGLDANQAYGDVWRRLQRVDADDLVAVGSVCSRSRQRKTPALDMGRSESLDRIFEGSLSSSSAPSDFGSSLSDSSDACASTTTPHVRQLVLKVALDGKQKLVRISAQDGSCSQQKLEMMVAQKLGVSALALDTDISSIMSSSKTLQRVNATRL